jgi:hypothetical protein
VEAELHVFSISALVGEQQSFHVPVTCTGAKKYRTDVWWTDWVGYSGDLNCYREIIGGGLRTGEGCSAANTILKVWHGLLQTW